jgi:hypothetical protein
MNFVETAIECTHARDRSRRMKGAYQSNIPVSTRAVVDAAGTLYRRRQNPDPELT